MSTQELQIPSIELGKYRHYKGHEYEVIGVGVDTETLEPTVIYKPLDDSAVPFWVRPYRMFFETVSVDGKSVPRFEKDTTKPVVLKGKTYISFIKSLLGSKMWQHLYVTDADGNEKDITNAGEYSSAYMVSSVLRMFDMIDRSHATVISTVREMERAGWHKVKSPQKGAVVEWKDYIGFYLADDFVVSSNSYTTVVDRHGLVLRDGRGPIAFWIHPELTV